MSRLVATRAQLEGILAHAREAAPDECCGVLVGSLKGSDRVVARVVRARNVDREPRGGYTLAPEDLIAIVTAAEREGLDVIGFYHSHPRGPPRPSARDVALATWDDAAYVLGWLEPEEGIAAWVWREEARSFEALPIARRD